jgi:hypothetical protein
MSTAYSGDGITFPDNSVQATAPRVGMVNRIINGDMRIDQRNAGAAVTSHGSFPIDRFKMLTTAGGAITGQQVTDAPVGFLTSIKITVTTAATPSGGVTGLLQAIEGYNSADLGMGTSGAKTFTLSFWVKSSISGNFGISFKNASNNRFYLTTYTINTANTWEYKTITVSGDTSGTWGTDNSTGLRFDFDLGTQASSRGSTINAWHTSSYVQGPTSGADLLSTVNATWQITGVQLEKGSTATDFEYVDYSRQLQMCQRYFEKSYSQGTAPATNTSAGTYNFSGSSEGNGNVIVPIQYSTKRTEPTLTGYLATGTSGSWNYEKNGASGTGSITFDRTSDRESRAYIVVGTNWAVGYVYGHWIASAEL